MFHIKEDTDAFIAEKTQEFSAEGFVNSARCVCNRKDDRRNAFLFTTGIPYMRPCLARIF